MCCAAAFLHTKLASNCPCSQWWCANDEDGDLREEPYDPDMASDDILDKLVLFWDWVTRGTPGWPNSRTEALVGVTG